MNFNITTTKAYSRAHTKLVYSGKINDFRKLKICVDLLERGVDLPPKYKNHLLEGEYAGLFECHIAFDFLLIYQKNEKFGIVTLIDLGSHSELFG